MNRPCLACGRLTARPTRCALCEKAHQAERNHRAGYRRTRQWQEASRAQRAAVPYCQSCGATDDLTADHVIPRSLDGGLITLCRACNAKKGDR